MTKKAKKKAPTKGTRTWSTAPPKVKPGEPFFTPGVISFPSNACLDEVGESGGRTRVQAISTALQPAKFTQRQEARKPENDAEEMSPEFQRILAAAEGRVREKLYEENESGEVPPV